MLVKSVDLSDQKLLDVISNVLRSGQFINGPYVNEFANRFAEYCGANYCVPVSSGTDAISLVLKTLKIRNFPGDKVIIPNLSFFSTASAVLSCGYTPIFCDVDEYGLMDMNMCSVLIDKYHDDIVCIIPVNLYGQYVDVPNHIRNRVLIIDDACQAHGLFRTENGSESLASCYSFYPSKNLGAIGDAGAIVTNDEMLHDLAWSLSNYGNFVDKYEHSYPEYSGNYRMDEIQAAVLCYKLLELDSGNMDRRMIAIRDYRDNEIVSYVKYESCRNTFHQYPILVDDRNLFMRRMKEYQIEVGIHYPYILSNKVLGIVEGSTMSKYIANHCVSLPIGDHLTSGDLSYVVNALTRIFTGKEDNMYIMKKEL